MRISVEAFGETELSRELLRFTDRADDMKPAFDTVRERFFKLEERQFSGAGIGPSGHWAPLAQGTLAGKLRAGLAPDILVATGRLKKSLTSNEEGDSEYETTKDSATIGSSVPYGVFHQSRAPRTHLPRRPPVDIPETEKKEWIKVLQRYLIHGGTE